MTGSEDADESGGDRPLCFFFHPSRGICLHCKQGIEGRPVDFLPPPEGEEDLALPTSPSLNLAVPGLR